MISVFVCVCVVYLMWVKQGRYIRIITYGALLSLPNLQGTRYDAYLCMYVCVPRYKYRAERDDEYDRE